MVKKVILALLIVFPVFTQAQMSNPQPTWQEFSVPWETKSKFIFWGGMALAVYLKQGLPDFVESTQRTWAKDKPLAEYSKYGDLMGQGIPNAIYFFGMLAHYQLSHTEKSKERAIFMAKSSLYSAAFTHTLKFAWQDPRPNNPDSKDSFPSGHATAAFAFASTVGIEHGPYWGAGAYALAAFVGLSRMNDNRHRLNEIIAGGAIGISYSLGLYYHHNPDKNPSVMVLPTGDGLLISTNIILQ